VVPPVTPAVPPEAGTDVEMVAPTGRPAVPPPMVTAPAAPLEPQPIRPIAESQPRTGVAEPPRDRAALDRAAASEPVAATIVEEHDPETTDAPDAPIGASAAAMADGDGEPTQTDESAGEADPVAGAGPENDPQPIPEAAVEPRAIAAPPVPAANDDANGVEPQRSRERGVGLPLSAFRRAASPVSATNGSGVEDEEEVLNLGDLGGAEESAGSDARDGDPLGLQGPLNR
jgi:hypothetical protein